METISASKLAGMFLSGAKRLEANKDIINELNVFPVPDGDTGTNMSMTIQAAANEVKALEDTDDIVALCKAISSGSLRGARGNSGVILSQILRGFTKVVKKEEVIDTKVLARGLQKATETAYRAVMKPKEGTMLTVIKGISNRANEIAEDGLSIEEFVLELVKRSELVLEKTPDMLPVLKEAGVVDSGGRGLVEILKGCDDYLNGREIEVEDPSDSSNDFKFLYEITFKLNKNKSFNNQQLQGIKVYYETIGDEISINETEAELEVSICSNEPGKILTKAEKSGELSDIYIRNKKLDSEKVIVEKEKAIPKSEWKEMGFVAVSIGEGMNNIFKELGADYIIEGGQTMNPSTEDILEAIEKVYAHNVFVLPNNKNILLAAEQAASLCEDKTVHVIKTTTLPHGISALINFMPDDTPEENIKRIHEEIQNISTGEITYAVRDTQIDNKKIESGDYMGIGESGILSVNKDLNETMIGLVKELVDEDSSLLSVYYGADVSEGDAAKMEELLCENFGDIEVEMQKGDQPVYFYVLSVE